MAERIGARRRARMNDRVAGGKRAGNHSPACIVIPISRSSRRLPERCRQERGTVKIKQHSERERDTRSTDSTEREIVECQGRAVAFQIPYRSYFSKGAAR